MPAVPPRTSLSPQREFHPFSSPARTSIPLWLRAIWSHSEEAMAVRWMTACHWRLQMRRSCWAHTTTLPPCILRSPAYPAQAWMPIFSGSCLKLGLEWSPPEETSHSRLDEWFLPGHARPLVNKLRHSSQRSTTRSPNLGMHPTHPAYMPLLPPPSFRKQTLVVLIQYHWLEGKSHPRQIHSQFSGAQAPSHFYTVDVCDSFPAETDENPYPELAQRLAYFGPVGGRDSISQIRSPR